MDLRIQVDRVDQSDWQTEGMLRLFVSGYAIFSCKTLELPWKDNERRVSRIPSGTYKAHLHIAPRFGKSIWVRDVPGRSGILTHFGNYFKDTLGCILVGREFVDIDGDGHKDVTDSKNTINELYTLIENEISPGTRFDFRIVDRFPKPMNPTERKDGTT